MKQSYKIAIGAVLIAAVAFYAGSKLGTGSSQNFQNMTPEQRQQLRGGAGAANGGGFGARRGQNGDLITGEIIQRDDKSITVKTRDGGSKIIFFSGTTHIGKTIDGAKTDLEVGRQVIVTGAASASGTISATSIDLRPVTAVPVANPAVTK